MQAICLNRPYQAEVIESPVPTTQSGQVLLRVLACGICGSDLNAWRGVPGVDYPLQAGSPGHEVWGEVVKAPTGSGLVPGIKVTGLVQQGFAQYAVANAAELVALSGDRLVLGEPLACAANVVRRAGVLSDQPVAVVGFGYLA